MLQILLRQLLLGQFPVQLIILLKGLERMNQLTGFFLCLSKGGDIILNDRLADGQAGFDSGG